MKIAIASDHAGFELKDELKSYLKSHHNITCRDFGTNSLDSVDYPDYGKKAAEEVSKGAVGMAILICGSGIGMCMAANKFPKVRAAVLRSEFDAKMSRQHNDANVACLGARVTPVEDIKKLLDIWLSTDFEGGRHARRVEKIG